ncbi:MAG: Gfo/Idh/MocA family oxidoreductase [Planctomycetaceae bacterium]|nr:Gfo/Idh/MocA family oxidoreductase [Planctomycetaceae bacterium]
MDRRRFLQTTAALAASGLAPRLFAANRTAKRRVGLIGCGWYGKVDLLRLLQVDDAEVVGLCDVDRRMLAEAAEIVAGRQKSGATPRTWSDYRTMLSEQEFDVMLVDTPDHWHALPSIEAMNHGIDLWVQKPISVDIREGQAMLATARSKGRVVQVGTQRRSTPHLVEAKERVIDQGLLGNVGMAEVYCYYHMRANRNPPNTPAPEYLDYEMWTGPAPLRPFNEVMHPRGWRAFMEYGNGIVGDMCIHMYDMVRWMFQLGWPTHVSSTGGILIQHDSIANIADTQTATFQHAEFPVVWQHRTWGDAPDPEFPWGATIYGDKGTLKLSVNKYEFTPRGNGKKLTGEPLFEYDKYPEDMTEKDLERHVASAVRRHMQNFLECIETRNRPVADIEEGHISTASCILANLSMKLQRSLQWDPVAHHVVGDDEANQLLARPYRSPWIHPHQGHSP